jgi:ubiquinone/menaquinone biosynthesis C-methylase UbiE
MSDSRQTASDLHKNVPPDWYHQSLRDNVFQRFWHETRFREIRKLIEPTNGPVLDIGCADGVFTKVIYDQSKAKELIAVDALASSIEWAQEHWKSVPGLSFSVAEAEALPFKDNTFTAAFLMEMLEHVFEPVTVLREVRRVLKPGGYAVILVPSENLLFKVIWYFWTKFRGSIWDGTHLHQYSGGLLPSIVREAGLTVVTEKKFLCGMLYAMKIRKPA